MKRVYQVAQENRIQPRDLLYTLRLAMPEVRTCSSRTDGVEPLLLETAVEYARSLTEHLPPWGNIRYPSFNQWEKEMTE